MSIVDIYVFVLAGFVGYQILPRVPAPLHPPLMAATTARSGISRVGSRVAAGSDRNTLATVLGVVAVTCAMANVVGGFLITDRMLRMFRSSRPDRTAPTVPPVKT
jgi:NAD(P) transhydrogenase subunit alpha